MIENNLSHFQPSDLSTSSSSTDVIPAPWSSYCTWRLQLKSNASEHVLEVATGVEGARFVEVIERMTQ